MRTIYLLLILSIFTYSIISGESLYINSDFSETGICGTPIVSATKGEPIVKKLLYKSPQADATFFIRDGIFKDPAEYIEVEFYKIFENDTVDIYVETDQLDNGNVNQDIILLFTEYILRKTPEESVNPEVGIIPSEYNIFGKPSDVDNNGKIIILLIDVRDDYKEGETETYVAGYFDPLDLSNKNKGNYGEIIYVDTDPGNPASEGTLSIIAHELQHLIHYNYDKDEDTWLNEGLSELAPRILGLPSRSFATFLNNTNRKLTEFDNSILDYSKVGLFFYYIYRQFGINTIKKIERSEENSLKSIELALNYEINKSEILERWFIANLINDEMINNGIYSYMGDKIPPLYSKHFHSSFNTEPISDNLNLAAAEYIQFSSGRNIDFELEYKNIENINLAIVKESNGIHEIEFKKPCPTFYDFSDIAFGTDYQKITFIPYRNIVTSPYPTINFSYTSLGQLIYEEYEVSYDKDSLDMYISLTSSGGEDFESVQKFILPDPRCKLKAIKFKSLYENPVNIKIYKDMNSTLIYTKYNYIPSGNSWTRIDINESELSDTFKTIYIGISSDNNSLGYSDEESGEGRAYIRVRNQFLPLSNFKVDNVTLTGNWLIRVIFLKPLSIQPKLALSTDSVFIWDEGKTKYTISISNSGTGTLFWRITDYPDFLIFDPDTGAVIVSEDITVYIDRGKLKPGLHNLTVNISSNGGDGKIFFSILQRNKEKPQAAILPFKNIFNDTLPVLKFSLINIGINKAYFEFDNGNNPIGIFPENGVIGIEDTIKINAYINLDLADREDMYVKFFNGVDTELVNFKFEGTKKSREIKLAIKAPFSNPFIFGRQQRVYIPVEITPYKRAELKIYNILGQLVKIYGIDTNDKNTLLLSWDGRDKDGRIVSNGVYFILLEQEGKIPRRKILFMK